jgi:amino-acid N-acetyltransferase
MVNNITITPIDINNNSEVIELLKNNNLPTEDITERTKIFALQEDDQLIGTVGLEYSLKDGLLRSLCIAEEKRNKGYGVDLVEFIERHAKEQGVENLYLLTTTADKFFIRRKYTVIDRRDVPEFIRKSSEFASVCPSTAIIMHKRFA